MAFGRLLLRLGLSLSFLRPQGGGGGFTNSAEAQQFFDRLISVPSSDRQVLYSALIDGLVADGTWALIDALYVFAAADSGTSLVNLKQDSFAAQVYFTAGVAPSFTADRGWLTSTVNASISSNFNPSTAAGNFARNSAGFGSWSLTSTQTNAILIATRSSAATIELYPKWSDNNTYWGCNVSAEQTSTGATDSSGWFYMQRTASNAEAIYRNDILLTSGAKTDTSAALVNEVLHFSGAYRHAAGVLCGGLSSGQRTNLKNSLQAYLTAVGAV